MTRTHWELDVLGIRGTIKWFSPEITCQFCSRLIGRSSHLAPLSHAELGKCRGLQGGTGRNGANSSDHSALSKVRQLRVPPQQLKSRRSWDFAIPVGVP